ncbi:MAG TPA: hypothetical protein IAC28_08635 [Candidatus Aphodovivens excrementavium]|nr:hypothetical protein [Candidatus Aphodovivens avistercoris]HIT46122.1 hypothetical protein [Candidatus Aphodovivens excrementavium]
MCFRPAMASAEVKCPRCGHPIAKEDGDVCPKCGLTKEELESGGLVPTPGKPGGLVPPPPAPPSAR